MRRPEIDVEGLAKTYSDGTEAVRGVDLGVEAGEVFALLGPNGAGKTTTVGMLTTTIRPTGGRASLAGFDVVRDPIGARSVAAVVNQDPAVDRALSGRRNLEIHARVWGVGRLRQRVDEIVGAFDLAEFVDRPVGSYSGGQRRRLEVGRALLSRPKVLFLDEPTVGLDSRVRHELLDLLGTLTDEGAMTILLTTHYLDEAERLCDRVAIMHDGRIVALDTPAALRASLGDRIVELRVPDDPALALAAMRAAGIAGTDAFSVGQTVIVPHHDHSSTAETATAINELRISASEVNTRPPTLDDVYLRLTGSRLAA
jgi:ABC-2 type transport system ATP-binding protein